LANHFFKLGEGVGISCRCAAEHHYAKCSRVWRRDAIVIRHKYRPWQRPAFIERSINFSQQAFRCLEYQSDVKSLLTGPRRNPFHNPRQKKRCLAKLNTFPQRPPALLILATSSTGAKIQRNHLGLRIVLWQTRFRKAVPGGDVEPLSTRVGLGSLARQRLRRHRHHRRIRPR